MNDHLSVKTLAVFEPDPDTVYTIEAAAHISQVSRRLIGLYCRHGLVSPVVDPECGGFYFNDEGIRTLKRIETLRHLCGANFRGVKMLLQLMNEVQRLQDEVRFLRGQ